MSNKKQTTFTRLLILLIAALIIILIIRPLGFLAYNYLLDKDVVRKDRAGYSNDASLLSETKIAQTVKAEAGLNEAASQISNLIKQAKVEGKVISIAGARHSMGGHTIYPDGIVLDMTGFHYMKYDSLENCLLVGSGALWSEIIPYLDKIGKSVSVMQSNNSFSVGGSVSVNCHGWQLNSAPIASTVRSFRLIDAHGAILNCSRAENPELFSLVLGGYGLFGVILDVKLEVTSNEMYKIQQFVIKSEDYIREFDRRTNAKTGMVYGRVNINPDNFMEEAILSTFSKESGSPLQALQTNNYTAIRRTVFRSSANSAYGKNLRWAGEKLAVSQINGKFFSRNQLVNEGVEVFQNTDADHTDILQEYFIPKESVSEFIKAARYIIPRYKVDLLNITIRNVMKDEDSYLKYANEEVFGFVMLFNQSKTKPAEAEMKALTQKLIDTAIFFNGTYYLPYRLHATKAQMYKAYPQAKEFFALKRRYDEQGVFQNLFYREYK